MKRTNAREQIELDAEELASLVIEGKAVDDDLEIVLADGERMRFIQLIDEIQ